MHLFGLDEEDVVGSYYCEIKKDEGIRVSQPVRNFFPTRTRGLN